MTKLKAMLLAGATGAAADGGDGTGFAAGWEPTKPVEIVVAAGAGGASDQMARMMQAAIQKNKLMKQPIIVSLKGGASGAEALIYMKSSDGDANRVLLAYSLIYMLPLSAKIPFNWRDLTPVAVTALDQFVLWDNTTMAAQERQGVRRRRQGREPAVQDGRHRQQARGPGADGVHGEEDRRQVPLPALQVRRRGRDPTRRQPHPGQRQQSVGEPRSLARRPGARALRVRQGAHRLQDQGHRHAILERHPDLQGGRPRRAVPDAARLLPAGQGDAGADRRSTSICSRRSRRPPNTRTTWRSRRSSRSSSPARTC